MEKKKKRKKEKKKERKKKHSEMFVRLNFQDGFWVVHLPFVCMVKLKFYAQFPVDYYYYYYLLIRFFPSALANGLSLEFEWQQVSLSLQDSCQYFGRSQ